MRKYRKFGVITLALLLILTGAFNGQGALTYADSNVGAQPIGSEPPAPEPAVVESNSVSSSNDPSDVVAADSGSIKTTDESGDVVNTNDGYEKKSDVYVYGSGFDITSGPYYFKVISPGGTELGNGYQEFEIDVNGNGELEVDGDTNINLWANVKHGAMAGFENTDNNGGSYNVRVSESADFSNAKNDHFKVYSGRVEVMKFDDVNGDSDPAGEEPVPGVEFELYDSDGVSMGIKITDGNGFLFFEDLPEGDYYLIELSDNIITTENDGGKIRFSIGDPSDQESWFVELEVGNKAADGTINICKDLASFPSDDTAFPITVYGPSDFEESFSLSGEQCELIDGLVQGWYKIVEGDTEGYELTGMEGTKDHPTLDGYWVHLNREDGMQQNITIENKNDSVTCIEVSKDITNADNDDKFLVDIVYLGPNPVATTIPLIEIGEDVSPLEVCFFDYGVYQLRERDTEGYVHAGITGYSTDGIFEIGRETGPIEFTIHNKQIQGDITVYKDVLERDDEGLEFGVKLVKLNTQVPFETEWKRFSEGAPYTFEDVPFGTYQIVELVSPELEAEGYRFSSFSNGDGIVVIDEEDEVNRVVVNNIKVPRINLYKTILPGMVGDEDIADPTASARPFYINIYYDEAMTQLVETVEISANDYGVSGFLRPGIYYLSENRDSLYGFVGFTGADVSEGNAVTVTFADDSDIRVTNRRLEGSMITINKVIVNAGGDPLPSDDTFFDIKVFNDNDEPQDVGARTIDVGEEIVFEPALKVNQFNPIYLDTLPKGKYKIVETVTDGYTCEETEYFVRLGGEPVEVTFTNRRDPILVINKVVENNLEDTKYFEFIVKTWCPPVVDTRTIECVPEVVFEGSVSQFDSFVRTGMLPNHRYTIEEIVPDGYKLVRIDGAVDGQFFLPLDGDAVVTLVNEASSLSITKNISNSEDTRSFGITVYKVGDGEELEEVGSISQGGEAFTLFGLYGTYRIEETSGTDVNWVFQGFTGDSTDGLVTIDEELFDRSVVVENINVPTVTTTGGGGGGSRRGYTTPEPEIIPDEPIPEAVPPTPEPELEVIIPEEIIPEGVPSLPFTGGMVELEWILMALGTTAFGSGLVIRKKKEKK